MTHAFGIYKRVSPLELVEEMKKASCLDLLFYISYKEEYPEEAKSAFSEFCLRYDQELLKAAEIFCDKWHLTETVALDIVNCTFAKVWKYPTYDHEKSNAKRIDAGIILWLRRIAFTQLANYKNKGTCYEPDQETDLSLVYSVDDLVERTATNDFSKGELKEQLKILDAALNQLGEKHRIIFLTYHLYTQDGNYLPRALSKKLQEELDLVPGSIRKYKEQAKKQVETFLKSMNHGNN